MVLLFCSGTIEINCSKDIKVQGIIGPCTSLEKVHLFVLCSQCSLNWRYRYWNFYWYLHFSQKGALCADTVVGQGNTTAWKMCGLDRNTSLTVFFDVSPSERSSQPGHQNPHLYIQFVTRYFTLFFSLWCNNGSISQHTKCADSFVVTNTRKVKWG